MILVCGENLIDYIQEPDDGGHPVYRANPGGSPFNTAMAIGRQELPTGYMNPISTDELGKLLRRTLEESDVTCLATPTEKPSALAVVSLKNGQPSYQFYHEDTADRQVTFEGLKAAAPDTVTACHIGGASIGAGADADAIVAFVQWLAGQGVPVTFDPNIRPVFIDDKAAYMARFDAVLAACSLLKLSDEDMHWLFPGEDIEAMAQALFDRSPTGLVVLTKGGDGAIGYTAGGTTPVPAAKVAALVDTVGAGDTFMATLVAEFTKRGLIKADDLSAASQDTIATVLETAARAAAINCGHKGCNPPTAAELHG